MLYINKKNFADPKHVSLPLCPRPHPLLQVPGEYARLSLRPRAQGLRVRGEQINFFSREEGLKTEGKVKGRRCCLGDRIDSIPCRASYFLPGCVQEGMNSSYSSYRPGAIHPILHIVLAQFILFLNRPYAK